MTRGFVTIATGNRKYYEMAKVLVKSYKLTTKNAMPFAVITDAEKEKFPEFDDVIVIHNARCSYMDKLDVMINSPYDESIFIDSDCIAFNDLNVYWEDFPTDSDFSAYGKIIDSNASPQEKGWFDIKDTGKYKGILKYSINLHGGIYFIRKSYKLDQIYSTCLDIAKNYSQYKFKNFSKPADEPIIALSMAVNGQKVIENRGNRFCFLRNTKRIKADFFERSLSYYFDDSWTDKVGMLIHFGTIRTIHPLYQLESRKVKYEWRHHHTWNILMSIYMPVCCCIISLFKGIFAAKKVLLKKYEI